MNTSVNVQPVYFDQASSCLTQFDLALSNTAVVAYNLESLLIRPGIEFLQSINFRSYFCQENLSKIVLNCASLKFNSDNQCKLTSALDGSKFNISFDNIINLIAKLDVDIVICPPQIDEIQLKKLQKLEHLNSHQPIKRFFVNPDNYISGLGVYLNTPQDIKSILEFINKYPSEPKYLCGHFSLDVLKSLKSYPNLQIENHKPGEDAYRGIFYRNMQDEFILDGKYEFEFRNLDNNCKCYTCENGFTSSYLHHLLKNTPLLAQRLLMLHNVFYINHLPEEEMVL